MRLRPCLAAAFLGLLALSLPTVHAAAGLAVAVPMLPAEGVPPMAGEPETPPADVPEPLPGFPVQNLTLPPLAQDRPRLVMASLPCPGVSAPDVPCANEPARRVLSIVRSQDPTGDPRPERQAGPPPPRDAQAPPHPAALLAVPWQHNAKLPARAEPAPPEPALEPPQEPSQEPVPSRWARDASPIGMAQAWTAAALLALPAALLLKALLPLLWRARAAKPASPVLENILDLLRKEPGIHHAELVRRIGRGNGTVEHHMARLLRSGEATRVRLRGHACYFAAAATAQQAMRLRMARQRTARRVLEAIASQPGLHLSALARRTGASVACVHGWVSRLLQEGLVEADTAGGRRRFHLAAPGRACLEGLAGAGGPVLQQPVPPPAGPAATAV